MKYEPIAAVWEITMGCNLRCKHCGSACENPLEDELTTEEALRLCDDMGKMSFKFVTLSGGEPTTRKDWEKIARRLRDNCIIPTMVTNAWLMNEESIERAIKAGIDTLGISLDGLKSTHDFIRKEGSFERIMNAFDLLRDKAIGVTPITTVNKLNIKELHDIKKLLIQKGIKKWQLQIGLPMGNMSQNDELVLEPEQIDQIIDFAYSTLEDKDFYVELAHGVGYYNKKEIELLKKSAERDGKYRMWNGCGAGKTIMGILHNGDVVGCTSIRDKSFIEGNIKHTPLKEIWENPASFRWNREMKKEKLKGLCSKCSFGSQCKGGCTNFRLTFNKEVYSENKYCSYNVSINKAKNYIASVENSEAMLVRAKELASAGGYQLAEIILSKYLETHDNIEALNIYGYVSYKLGNYQIAKSANEAVLKLEPDNAYGSSGMGLTLIKLGELNKGIEYLKKAVYLTDENYMEPYYDLAVALVQSGRREEAASILEEGRKLSGDFAIRSQELYNRLMPSETKYE